MTAAGGSEPPAALILRELIQRGLLSAADAVEQGIVMHETSVSHRSYQVQVGGEPRLFVKRADPVRSQGRDLREEAAVYRLARSTPALARVMPACLHLSADDTLIVLEAVPTDAMAMSLPNIAVGPSTLKEYGRAVAHVHSVQSPPFGRPPWLLTAFEPRWNGYPWLPEACRRLLIRLAARPPFPVEFQVARDSWTNRSLVHGDLRWANVLPARDAHSPRVWLVDWELACGGDPAWDVGSVLADLLASMESRTETDPIVGLIQSATPFLQGYRDVARLDSGAWLELLGRSVRLAGVRLVQTLVEYGHVSEADLEAAEQRFLRWAASLLVGSSPASLQLASAAGRSVG